MRSSLWVLLGCCACSRELVELIDQNEIKPPSIDNFSPLAGLAGQTVVRVEGSHFPDNARVFFGAQEGVWAVGPQYNYSDTVVFGIPPFGAESTVEISVRGSSGEGRARDLFRLFNSEPQMVELSTDRITRATDLVVRGQSFNPDDFSSRLLIGAQEVPDFTISTDRIVPQLATVPAFPLIGSGWKLIRYHYTPYVAGDPDETAMPVYVVQPPEIVDYDFDAYADGHMEIEVRHYDAFRTPISDSFADNPVNIGGQPATIESVRSGATPDAKRLTVRVPQLGSGQFTVEARNLAGSSFETEVNKVTVLGPGRPRPGATITACDAVDAGANARSGVFQDLGNARAGYALALAATLGDTVVTVNENGVAERVWSALPLPYVHKLAYLGVPTYGMLPITVALVADRPPQEVETVGEWALVVITGDRLRVLTLDTTMCPPGVCTATSGAPPALVAPDRCDAAGCWLGLFFPPSFVNPAGRVLVAKIASDPETALQITEVPYAPAQAPVKVALLGLLSDFARVAVAFAGELQVWAVSPGAAPFLVGAQNTGWPFALSADAWAGGKFYLVDYPLDLRIWAASAYSPSFTSINLPATASVSFSEARVANAYLWLAYQDNPRVEAYHAESTAAASVRMLFSAEGYNFPRVVVHNNEVPLALQTAWAGPGIIAGIRHGAGAANAALQYEVLSPELYGSEQAVGVKANGHLMIYQPNGAIVHDPYARTANFADYRMPAQQALAYWGGVVVIGVHSAEGSSPQAAPRGVVWRSQSQSNVQFNGDLLLDSPDTFPLGAVAAATGLTQVVMALYQNDVLGQRVQFVGFDPTNPSVPCNVGQVTSAAPGPSLIADAVARDELPMDLLVVPRYDYIDTGGRRQSMPLRLFAAFTGTYLNGVYELDLSQCNNVPLTPVVIATGDVKAAAVDRRGARLYVQASSLYIADTSIPVAAGNTYATEVATPPYQCNVLVEMVATRDGVIGLSDTGHLCRLSVPPNFAGGSLGSRYTVAMGDCFYTWAPNTSLVLTADEDEVWIGRHITSNGVPILDRLCQIAASGGGLRGTVDLADLGMLATDLAGASSADEMKLLAIPYDAWTPDTFLRNAGTSWCSVR